MRITPLVLSLLLGGCAGTPEFGRPGLADVDRASPARPLLRLGATSWTSLWALTEAAVLVPVSPYLLFWDLSVGLVLGAPGATARDGAAAEGWEMNRELWRDAQDRDFVASAPLHVLAPVFLGVLEPLTSVATILGGVPGS